MLLNKRPPKMSNPGVRLNGRWWMPRIVKTTLDQKFASLAYGNYRDSRDLTGKLLVFCNTGR